MHRLKLAIVTVVLAALSSEVIAQEAAPSVAYRVVVNSGNPITSVDRRVLGDLFWKKVTQWPNGEVARPVDLPSDSPVRRRFAQEVLGRSTAAVRSYWNQIIFSGRGTPPPELDSDQEVIRFVLKHSGAIGYVSGGADVSGAKVISVR